MSIVAGSTIEDVMTAYNNFKPTATELAAWNNPTTSFEGRPVVSIGLWGADLNDFHADCLVSTECATFDFTVWNGWALGVDWTSADDLTADIADYVFIEDVKSSTLVNAAVIW